MTTSTDPTDFGARPFPAALVNVTNRCNLECAHCFVFRDANPNAFIDRMDDETMLHQLEVLRDRHGIKSMLFMGGEPMVRRKLVLAGMDLFEHGSIVTNGTYGIPCAPGHLVSVSLDGPPEENDAIRGEGVFAKVEKSISERDPDDGTIVMLQMAITKQNAPSIERFVEAVIDWPVDGVAFTFYVPQEGEQSDLAWDTNEERDEVVDRVIALKRRYPELVKTSVGTLELMKSDQCLDYVGDNCALKSMLPLYVGDGGVFERTFCCYGNDVDCDRCGAYAVFNAARHREQTSTPGPTTPDRT
ncbi:MAG: radical SAM protein [Actinomycetia bacterium]|nr:radical SAM protein [Actinomycetes bacterium]MCP5030662.1 radical SAM protein [Actinomycetes bacterium]